MKIMKKLLLELIVLSIALTYATSDIGKIKIKNFVESKINNIVNETIGQQLDSIGRMFDNAIQ